MKAVFLWFLLLVAVVLMANEPVGVWNFNDPENLTGATIGNDLVLVDLNLLDMSHMSDRTRIERLYAAMN